MTTFTWNAGSGTFSTPGNWTPSGPPGSGDLALFNANSGTIGGNGTVATLNLSAGGPWTFTGAITSNFFYVNDSTTLAGPGVWTLAGSAASGNYIIVANGASAVGTLVVSGGGTINSTEAATTAAYGLYVGGGNSATGANGSLTVTGSGSSVSTGPNGAAVGEVGTGTLTVTNGASASFASSNSAVISSLAVARQGSGTVNVSAGSSLTAAGYVYVGRGGTGALNVTGGSTFTGGSAASGSVNAYGIAIGDGSPATSTPVYYGGSGTALVDTGSTLHSLGSVAVGQRGTTGSLTVNGASAVLADVGVFIGTGTDRPGGTGTLLVENGSTVRSGVTQSNGNAAIDFGNDAGTSGTGTVTGSGSVLNANGYRLTIGGAGTGSLTIAAGGRASSGAAYTDTEAALAVASGTGSTGTLTITGTGSSLAASGTAVIGGNNRGSGVTAGGVGTVSVSNGGSLQTGALFVEAGSILTVDASSTLVSSGLTLAGGSAVLATLTSAAPVSFTTGGTLTLTSVVGSNTVTGFGYGDKIDFAGTTAVSLSGSTVSTSTGSIALGAAPANSSYKLLSDGQGGTFVALEPQTIGVYRFFDTKFGTHFYTADANEAATINATRPDLTPEGPGGIGLAAVSVSANDPNATAVFRFFDTVHGTHFFTASTTERDQVIASRPDLTYEPTGVFYEHATQQAGDTPVYRLFDTVYGTHFYTDSASELAGIQSSRPDLHYEGIGFYEPPQNTVTA